MMKKVTLVALVLGLSFGIGLAQAPVNGGDVKATELAVNEKAPSVNPALGAGEDVGDFLFDIDVETITSDIRCLGVENDGTDWWITGAADMLGAFLYRIDAGGALLNTYAQGKTSWGWRDLVYDGTYLYASDSFVIEEIDPVTGMATGITIASPVSPARALAYDPNTDSFWTASFSSSLYNVMRDGTSMAYTNPGGLAIYGAAYETTADVVWWWSQDGSGTLASAMATDGTFTGDSFDGGSAPIPGIAGGAAIYDDPTYGTVFAGMHQASPDNVAVYEILPDPFPVPDVKVNGKDAGAVIADTQNATMTIDIQARQGAGVNVDVAVLVQRIGGRLYAYDGATWTPGGGTGIYYTGPLADVMDTVLDQVLPVGMYVGYLMIDDNPNGIPDFSGRVRLDMVDFEVTTISGLFEDFEDGVADNWIPDGTYWSITTDPDGDLAYYLDCPFFDRFSAYYDFDYSDFSMYSADIQQELTTSFSDVYFYGLHFRSDGTIDNGYDFYTMGTAAYNLYVRTGGTGTLLTSGTMAPWNGNAGNYNNVAVSAVGPTIDIYCNGVLQTSVSDSTYTSGKVGVNGEGSGGFDHNYWFDNITLIL